ncbi:hypothetical protein ACFYPA_12660 [Streptomyces sp. NPDC005775]|uniref:hypothetical protein n=1 Tax=unclassified Streptomyces TaxID=2593676 RepID=UPI0033FE4E46
MTGKDVERTDERVHAPEPWWADLGTWGAVALMALGGLAAVWAFFRLPGTPENIATGYYQAAKIAAIGLVIAGTALLGRDRDRDAAAGETDEAARD